MSYKFEEGKDLIIKAVVDKVSQKMEGKQAVFCMEFVRQFFTTAALDDLQEWSVDDLSNAAINFWSLIQSRSLHETKIQIYNPTVEKHGWQTPHTIVEIITDDMPFLVDSLRIVINRLNLISYLMIHMGGLRLKRDKKGQAIDISPRNLDNNKDGLSSEAAIFIEIEKLTDQVSIERLQHNIEIALKEDCVVVSDWLAMRKKVCEAIDELEDASTVLDREEVEEAKAFLNWIEDHHFTFLGLRDYKVVGKGKETILEPLPETGLGILRSEMSTDAYSISTLNPEALELTLSTQILVISKTNTEANVHRQAYTDYIGIKRFNKKGEVIGERRIIGLYTSAAYNASPKHIPFLRRKVAQVMSNSHLNPRGHAGKILLNILETLPRDDLIQASADELLELAMGIYYIQDRRRIRLFARTDVYRRFVSCLVYVPKDRYNSQLRASMQQVLAESFHSNDISFATWFPESVLARIHFIVRTDPRDQIQWDIKAIEQKLIDVGRTWIDDLQYFLFEVYGEEQGGQLYKRYKEAFPIAYTANFLPRTAVHDIKYIENLSRDNPLMMDFYKPAHEAPENFRLKIYQNDTTTPLSDVLPILESLGMRAISERPYALKFDEEQVTWINEFALQYTKEITFELDKIKELFQEAFTNVWFGHAENDCFNQLILAASLNWRQVAILRTYAKYFKQIGFTFSQDYIETALNNNPAIVKKLVELFEMRFNPLLATTTDRNEDFARKMNEILTALDAVANLDEDKIIRQYAQAISATLRTNYYQVDEKGYPKSYLSIKLSSKEIPGMPKPYPMFEIFVYSPRVEGVHLRCSKVARGGLRWSDRREDFRTEILGLMKAQQVKNAVIVPSGAKGGFVPKQLPINGTREEILAEGIDCYKLFIHGLLDLTDNYIDGVVIKPPHVVCFDNDDHYLVVAADKGTATFSDIANAISFEYGFWLGDAFASGGSVGYDHKKMGITAKGAWESVERHFYEMNRDMDNTPFTVVGIGDMAGDVFGNGMLLSTSIKLVAAFNHIHIFVDPDPDPRVSFEERKRLFNLPRSSWTDYNKQLISKGGGVFNRNAKSIPVSKEMKQRFGINQATIEPNELIRVILKAEVDLLWSAGIGTFVKAEAETHASVGDKLNDPTRVNANQLRAKVVGEGGNLGMTQLARVEYSLNEGLVYTDFIDNSAGVNCSDKEVNIKILLNGIVAAGDLTEKQRNQLLEEMTDEVAQLVLRDNFTQPRAISVAGAQALRSADLLGRYINELERGGKLDRALEFLPDEKTLEARKLLGKGLTYPDIAVLLCYSKTLLKEEILASNVPEDTFLKDILLSSFPTPLQKRFSQQMQTHPLKREIIATRLSNIIVNEMGPNFVYRQQDETGAPTSAIVRAYMIARSILNLESIYKDIDQLGAQITAEKQTELMRVYIRLLRRMTRWFLRRERIRLDITKIVELYEPRVQEFKKVLPDVLSEASQARYHEQYKEYIELGMPVHLAHELTLTDSLFSVLDIIEVSHQLESKIAIVAEAYFAIGEFLDLEWIRSQVIIHPTENNWESLSREALRDDLDWQQRQLTAAGIINYNGKKKDVMALIKEWSHHRELLIKRWREILAALRSATTLNYTMFFVAIRELLDLTQTTAQTLEVS